MMHNELTNLLPPERQRAFRQDYFIRLGVVVAVLATALVLSAAVLLLPTYVFLSESDRVETEHLAAIESTATSSDSTAFSAQLTTLSNNAAALSALADATSVSSIIAAVLTIPRPGVTLSGFAYTPATSKNQETLAISGSAKTRDTLRSYQLALQRASFASAANLPVSTYAKDSDIPFTITVTLAP